MVCTSFISFLSLSFIFVLVSPYHVYKYNFGGTSTDIANGIAPGPDGTFYLSGQSYSFSNGAGDIWTIRVDRDGSLMWSHNIGCSGNDITYQFDSTLDGGCVIAGSNYCPDGATEKYYVAKYNSDGSLAWEILLGNEGIRGRAVFSLSNGDYITGGRTAPSSLMIKISSAGQYMWHHEYNNAQVFRSIIETSNNEYVALGVYSVGNAYTYMRIDSLGNTVIAYAEPEIPGKSTEINYVIQLSNTYFVVCGTIAPGTSGAVDLWMGLIAPTGNLAGYRQYGSTGSSAGWSVQLVDATHYAFSGTISPGDYGGTDMIIIFTDPSGNIQSVQHFGGAGDDYGTAMRINSEGTVGIGGYSPITGKGQDFYLVLMYKECTAGKYFDETTYKCTDCPTGKYQDAASQKTCKTCSYGTYQDTPGQTSCKNCLAGKHQDQQGKDTCDPCPVGSYTDINTQKDCVLCGYGKYQDQTGQTGCKDCLAGTYQDLQGQIGCKDCLSGTYTNAPAQKICVNCLEGTYQDSIGQINCKNCDPGTYQDTQGQSSCKSCLAGYYTDAPGQKICAKCPVGYYQDQAGQPNCLKCKIYTYQDQQGQTSCKACGDGFYQDLEGQAFCKTCHKLCKTCYGPSFTDCILCTEGVLNLYENAPQCECNEGYFYDSTKISLNQLCQPCPDFCKTCSGQICFACINNGGVNKIGTTCKCNVAGYFPYYNSTINQMQCVKCHPLCMTCTGPETDMCGSCDASKKAILISLNKCDCEQGYFYNEDKMMCEKCSSICKNCFGPNSDQCTECINGISYNVENILNLCVTDCLSLISYYKSSNSCKKCHTDCLECIGSLQSQCTKCADPLKVMYNNECKDSCPLHFYASQDHICQGILIKLVI